MDGRAGDGVLGEEGEELGLHACTHTRTQVPWAAAAAAAAAGVAAARAAGSSRPHSFSRLCRHAPALVSSSGSSGSSGESSKHAEVIVRDESS